ncbi:ubiqutin C-terminal hydrolase of the cysteine proteinase fold [Cryptosporidium ubiquitum]|uniref:Ubiqutin C-terminal hydrolase of the cysteine proteinase fold n=1 Tax=Cryptosporidium ubiquitum TaxID=857276 RepID=A0A1J4MQ85_9CRYT|nr:ubiqutin C-terminal hydrolase of the cysteine proteinase fold [Cryptosporidium ubiquitum]OII75053.1 ubiqutin C-terminal hydrolase of the cysteine proteinase fold [Cryptosporidium ubiquitum]
MENKDEHQEGESGLFCIVNYSEENNEDVARSNLEEGVDEVDIGSPTSITKSSVSDSYSSVSSSPFISISTKFSGSIRTDCSISQISPGLDLEPYFFGSSSESSIPTFPTNIDSGSRKSQFSTNILKKEEYQNECMNGFSLNTSEKSLEELLSENLTINGIVMKNLNDLVSTYSGDLLSELIKLDLKSIVENLFGIYSKEYYEKSLPLICSFLSILLELSFNENKLNELNIQLWTFFEYIMKEILQIFDIKEVYDLPLIPVVYWMIENWNRYDIFLTFKHDQKDEEAIIKGKLNGILFSLHIRKDLEAPSAVLEYYFRLILDYRPTDAFQGCILYVIKSTQFLINYLLLSDDVNFLEVNYRGIIEIFNNFDQNRIQIFSRTLDVLISNSNPDQNQSQIQDQVEYLACIKTIPIYFFLAFFLIKYPEQNTIQKILLDIITSICDSNSLEFEHKKQSIIHIINLILYSCKNTSSGGTFDMSVMDLLLEIFNLEVWKYLDRPKTLEALNLLDEIIRDLTKRLRLGDCSKNEFEAISGLYKLQSILLVGTSDSFKNRDEKRGKETYSEYGEKPSENSWKSRLINNYLTLNEKDKRIRNVGNTCYLNSTIQCLALSYYFLEWLHEYMRNNFSKPNKLILYLFESLSYLLEPIKKDRKYDIIGKLYNNDDAKSIDIRFIREISDQFSFGKQHDACEFLRYLLTNIDDDCLPFMMTTEDFVECLSCGVIQSKESYSLSIIDLYVFNNTPFGSSNRESFNLNNDTITLDSLIKSYFSAEKIPNSLDCDHCQQKSASKRWISLKNPSKYVVLAIHNYYWDRKLNKAIKQTQLKIKFNDFFILNNHKYIIYALVFHKGESTSSGHYFAIGRKHFYDNYKQKNPNWFNYNDSIVSNIESFYQVQKSSENPFLIFALLADN